jgi:hypothetical protein
MKSNQAMNTKALTAALAVPDADEGNRTKTASTEKGSGQKVTEYAKRISANWQKSTDAILKVAADCAAAKNDLTRSEKRDLFERLPFGESMFSKLASIGNDTRLYEHKELMPPSISTMCQIQELSHEQFETAKTEKVLRPDVTRDQVQEWTLGKTDKPARIKSNDLKLHWRSIASTLSSLWMQSSPLGFGAPLLRWRKARA